MATGRVPKIQGLGLEEVGVKLGKCMGCCTYSWPPHHTCIPKAPQTYMPMGWSGGNLLEALSCRPPGMQKAYAG